MEHCNIKIETSTGIGCLSKVVINGVDYSSSTTRVEFEHQGGKIPLVKITLIPDELEVFAVGDAWIKNVSIGANDADAWKPMGLKLTDKGDNSDGFRRWIRNHFQRHMDK